MFAKYLSHSDLCNSKYSATFVKSCKAAGSGLQKKFWDETSISQISIKQIIIIKQDILMAEELHKRKLNMNLEGWDIQELHRFRIVGFTECIQE